eukprot:CFRG7757T1
MENTDTQRSVTSGIDDDGLITPNPTASGGMGGSGNPTVAASITSSAQVSSILTCTAEASQARLPSKQGLPLVVTDTKDILCPVCRDPIKEPTVSKCGHSFCSSCIYTQLDYSRTCPVCGEELRSENLFHNFLLDDLVSAKARTCASNRSTEIKDLVTQIEGRDDITQNDLESLLKAIQHKRARLDTDSEVLELEVMCDFFEASLDGRRSELERLQNEIFMMERDHEIGSFLKKAAFDKREIAVAARDAAKRTYDEMNHEYNTETGPSRVLPAASDSISYDSVLRQNHVPSKVESINNMTSRAVIGKSSFGLRLDPSGKRQKSASNADRQSNRLSPYRNSSEALFEKKKAVVRSHLSNITEWYFKIRRSTYDNREALSDFRNVLKDCTRYSKFEEKSFFAFSGLYNHSSIVSSIEFNKDGQFFATAGVSKCIKVFDFETMVNSPTTFDNHVPVKEMVSTSKISCLSYNPYIKQQISSCDYEGVVSLWDTCTGQTTRKFGEHEKRAWSVDFCPANPQLLASGSDDSKVKIWSANRAQSIKTIQSSANVCCVRFSPSEAHYLAFGSADHHIHYYDLRAPQQPLHVLKGHRKAVSYVRFLNNKEIVSASTDSTLKLWSLDTENPLIETYTGHTNDRNFVGLTTNKDYIACGSETNAVFGYYKALSSPVASFRFATFDPITGEEVPRDDVAHFVSSVCWRPNSNMLVAANSQGLVKVLTAV